MGFFKKAVQNRKRKLGQKRKSDGQSSKRVKRDDEEILSSEEDEGLNDIRHKNLNEDDEEIYEDIQAKTVRESRRVLDQLVISRPGEADISDEDLDAVAHRLKEEEKIHVHRKIADKVVIKEDSTLIYRPHKHSPVCVALSNCGRFVVSCSKDGSIVKYDIESNKKIGVVKHKKDEQSHAGKVRCVAISGDDKYIASGGDDTIIRIWLFEDLSHVRNFPGHRGPVTSLVFRQGSNDLYSSSTDKAIRAWDLNQLGFVEIIYGHADSISQLDMLDKPKLLSAGSSARTIHLFKTDQSSQLVFNGLNDCISIDTVSMINDEHFVSGQMDGSLYVWSIFKKKPVCVVKNAHGVDENNIGRWIVSVAALPFSDLVASGSFDNKLKLWKVGENYKSLVLIDAFQLTGFLNDIRFSADGKILICSVGQAHRDGRWWKCQEARNSIVVLRIEMGHSTGNRMLQFNTLIIHVVRVKDLPAKGKHHLDAYASLNITGTDKWRSKVVTQPNRVNEDGSCNWDEHLEFQLNECYTRLTININHKSKLGTSETLASLVMNLGEMPHIQPARWFQLYKKGNSDKLRGMLLMSYEFKNIIGGLSISQTSLNTIGKETKLDKLKRRMNFGRKKAKMDAQSMISVSLSRRSSICSNTSALAFSPVPSPIPPSNRNSPHDSVSLCSPPDPRPSPNQLVLSGNSLYQEKHSSTGMEDSTSYSDAGDLGKKSGNTTSKFATKFRQKADQLLHIGSNRKPTEETHHDNSFVDTVPETNSRPQSIASSSGFASIITGGNLDNLNHNTSKGYLLQVITQLRKELLLKEQRIQDLEDYTGRLLSKIIERNPELLQVETNSELI